MSVEVLAISGLVVAVLGALSQFVKKSNLKHCNFCGFDSDCRDEDKMTNIQIKELNEKIERNEKKISKNKTKLDVLKKKRRLSNAPETPDSLVSETSFDVITEI
jgi:hypothetical protein